MKTTSLYLLALLLSLASSWELCGQVIAEHQRRAETRSHILSELASFVSEGLLSEAEYEHGLEVLDRLLLHPLDINAATADELREIPLLSEYQIYQLTKARADAGGFDSVYDLKLLPGWGEETTRWVLPLLTCKGGRWREQGLWRDGRMSYALTATRLVGREEERLGSTWGSSLRWGYRTRGGLSAFVGAELDRGEPWAYEHHRGFDSYAGHIAFRGQGRLRQIILGDYRASWGQGLLIGQGQSFGRLSLNLGHSRASTLRPVSGVSEANKLRGLALEYAWSSWRIMGLVSRRWLDGRIGENDEVYGFGEDGLHRTATQWQKRHRVPMTSWGARLAYEREQLTLAVQHLRYHWGGLRLVTPPGTRGIQELALLERHSGTSLSYSWRSSLGRMRLSGEVARDVLGSWATVHELWYRGNWGEVTLAVRKLEDHYWSYFGSSRLAIALHPRDEQGLRLSASTKELARGLELSGLVDLYCKPSSSEAGVARYSLLFLRYTPKPTLELWGQCTEHDRPSTGTRRRLRLGARLLLGEWSLEAGASRLWLSSDGTHPRENSYEIDGRLRYESGKRLVVWTSVIYFDAPSWRSRLYAYEPRTRYDYGSIFLWGQGLRWALGAKWRATDRLRLETKIAHLDRGRLYPREHQLWLTLVFH